MVGELTAKAVKTKRDSLIEVLGIEGIGPQTRLFVPKSKVREIGSPGIKANSLNTSNDFALRNRK